jgi:hypothetical protein
MATTWQIALEGTGAKEAIESLNESPELDLQWEEKDEITREAGIFAILATVVAMTGGVIAIAEQIRKWRDLWKEQRKNGDKVVDTIILIDGDRRLVLNNATQDQIIDFIKKLK